MIDRDLAFIFLCACRYAMGRRSAAPSMVTKIVVSHIDVFTDWELGALAREISEEAYLGDPCDVATWHDFAQALRDEIVRRASR
jgi:hypothetical protein